MVQQVAAAEAHVVLGAVHVVLQLTEGHLRLNHPELCQVPAGVAVCTHHRNVTAAAPFAGMAKSVTIDMHTHCGISQNHIAVPAN